MRLQAQEQRRERECGAMETVGHSRAQRSVAGGSSRAVWRAAAWRRWLVGSVGVCHCMLCCWTLRGLSLNQRGCVMCGTSAAGTTPCSVAHSLCAIRRCARPKRPAAVWRGCMSTLVTFRSAAVRSVCGRSLAGLFQYATVGRKAADVSGAVQREPRVMGECGSRRCESVTDNLCGLEDRKDREKDGGRHHERVQAVRVEAV